jgi:hypothetical protein
MVSGDKQEQRIKEKREGHMRKVTRGAIYRHLARISLGIATLRILSADAWKSKDPQDTLVSEASGGGLDLRIEDIYPLQLNIA